MFINVKLTIIIYSIIFKLFNDASFLKQASGDNAASEQQMGSQQRWQRSTCHQGSSTIQHRGSSLRGTRFHHTACWQPSSQAAVSGQQMGSQQQWQHSTCHQGSSTSQHRGSSHLGTQFHHTVLILTWSI